MKSNGNLKKAIIIFVFAGMVIWAILNYINYISSKTNNEVSEQDQLILMDEFKVYDKSNLVFDCIFSKGSDWYGIRYKIDSKDNLPKLISNSLNLNLSDSEIEDFQMYLNGDSFQSYTCADDIKVQAKLILPVYLQNTSYTSDSYNTGIYIYTLNNTFYMELTKSSVDCISIYEK